MTDDELALLTRVVAAAERIAASHERFCRVMELANDIDPDVEAIIEPEPLPRKKGEREPPDPFALWTDDQEETAAVIEWLEDAGVRVPPEAYKRLGLDPPEREDEPTDGELEAAQPGADGEEPTAARGSEDGDD